MKLRFFEGTWQASVVDEKTIVFFDSDCLLCQGALKWLNRLDAGDRLRFAPLSGETAVKWKVDTTDDSMAVVRNGETYRASEAARLAFLEAGGVGRVIALILKMIPIGLRNRGYYWIARNRKSLVKSEACGIPEEGMREKLLD